MAMPHPAIKTDFRNVVGSRPEPELKKQKYPSIWSLAQSDDTRNYQDDTRNYQTDYTIVLVENPKINFKLLLVFGLFLS
jgi:hypothetical protein